MTARLAARDENGQWLPVPDLQASIAAVAAVVAQIDSASDGATVEAALDELDVAAHGLMEALRACGLDASLPASDLAG